MNTIGSLRQRLSTGMYLIARCLCPAESRLGCVYSSAPREARGQERPYPAEMRPHVRYSVGPLVSDDSGPDLSLLLAGPKTLVEVVRRTDRNYHKDQRLVPASLNRASS